jgi:hypothetical protein
MAFAAIFAGPLDRTAAVGLSCNELNCTDVI